MRILLAGHACSPDHGSEPAVTWTWALSLARHAEVWVLTHPVYRSNVEAFLEANPNPNLRFHWVTLPNWLDPWKPPDDRFIRIHYVFWQHALLKAAKDLHRQVGFDLSHYVSWNTIAIPPLLWQLPIPFVWGPVGGGHLVPAGFERYLGRSVYFDKIRSLNLSTLKWRPSMRAVVRNAAAILATNHETRRLLEAANAKNVMLMNVTGLRDDYVPDEPPPPPQNTELQLLWAGRLEAFKGLDLALEALKLVADLPVQLLVAGEGPMREAWENKVSRLGLDGKVSFLGQMSWHEIKKQYASADAFVFTSLRDSFGSVVLEAMAHGKPILTLNHQGVGCFVPDDAGFKVTVESPQATVRALADGIRQLQANPHLRQQMGRAAHRYALSERQSLRTEFILGLYRQLLSKRDHARFA